MPLSEEFPLITLVDGSGYEEASRPCEPDDREGKGSISVYSLPQVSRAGGNV